VERQPGLKLLLCFLEVTARTCWEGSLAFDGSVPLPLLAISDGIFSAPLPCLQPSLLWIVTTLDVSDGGNMFAKASISGGDKIRLTYVAYSISDASYGYMYVCM